MDNVTKLPGPSSSTFPPNKIPSWSRLANICELCIILFDLILGSLIINIVSRHPMFHKNLLNLMQNLGFSWVVAIIGRCMVTIGIIIYPQGLGSPELFITTWPLIYAEGVRIAASVSAISTLFCVILERILATIQLQSYEKQRNVPFVAFCIAYAWISGGVAVFMVFSTEINLFVLSIFGAFGAIVVILMFLYLDRINRQRYRDAMRGVVNYTLSQRFQLSENIRSSTILKRFLMVTECAFFFIFGVMGYDSFLAVDRMHVFVTRTVFNMTICFMSLFGLLVAVYSTVFWRREFLRLLRNLFSCRCHSPLEKPKLFYSRHNTVHFADSQYDTRKVPHGNRSHLRNGDGKLMAFSQEEEREITLYFGLVLVSTKINRAVFAKHLLGLARQLSQARLVWRQLSHFSLIRATRNIPQEVRDSPDPTDSMLASSMTLFFVANALIEFVAWIADAKLIAQDAGRWFRYSLFCWIAALITGIIKCVRRIHNEDFEKTKGDQLQLVAYVADLLPALNALPVIRFPVLRRKSLVTSKLTQFQSAFLSLVASAIGFYRLF
ncbi:sre G protein-coupled chemoreceptor domain-containing protein [Ditylenchus destructor]|uniref:Sre G protein-coupled chemoreceptor domain-containing protein n=1 Tax=Ditylenchus destructor TaxID=166010 RepID=A0AAD4MZR5_9BILA|nr:sre G protein-coupled chemoreceptor domain-containing protein [Ditylenchus destructor]